MDEVFFVVGTVQNQGRYLEFWVEGWSTRPDQAEAYADRLNRIHEQVDDVEEIVYLVLSAFALNAEALQDYGLYEA